MVKQHADATLPNDRLALCHWSGSVRRHQVPPKASGVLRGRNGRHTCTNKRSSRESLKYKPHSLWFGFTAFVFPKYSFSVAILTLIDTFMLSNCLWLLMFAWICVSFSLHLHLSSSFRKEILNPLDFPCTRWQKKTANRSLLFLKRDNDHKAFYIFV